MVTISKNSSTIFTTFLIYIMSRIYRAISFKAIEKKWIDLDLHLSCKSFRYIFYTFYCKEINTHSCKGKIYVIIYWTWFKRTYNILSQIAISIAVISNSLKMSKCFTNSSESLNNAVRFYYLSSDRFRQISRTKESICKVKSLSFTQHLY